MEEKNSNNTFEVFYVFLDTEVFVSNNFDFSNRIFKQFNSLVSDKKIVLLTTPLTIDEIKSNLNDSINKSKTALKKFIKDGKILRLSIATPFHEIWKWKLSDFDEVYKDLIGQMYDYIKDTKMMKLTLEGISIEKVFSDYFKIQPPFNEGNKKCEFPDAFAIAALELWSTENNKQVYVISNDNDWKRTLKSENNNFILFEKPEEFIQMIQFLDENIEILSEKIFYQHYNEIDNFINENFFYLGFVVDFSRTDLTVDDEHVEKIIIDNINLDEKFLIQASSNSLIFNCIFEIDFSADIFYIDNTNAAYDSESDNYYFGDKIHETINITTLTPIEMKISYNQNKEDPKSEIVYLKFLVNDIEFEFPYDDGYPYK